MNQTVHVPGLTTSVLVFNHIVFFVEPLTVVKRVAIQCVCLRDTLASSLIPCHVANRGESLWCMVVLLLQKFETLKSEVTLLQMFLRC